MAERAQIIIEATDKASAKLKKIGSTGERSLKGLKVAAGIAAAGIVGIGVAIGGAIALLSKFARATEIQEQAELQLANALRNAGQDAEAAMPKLKGFASGLQDMTTFGDEAILQMQSLLVSLGGLKGEGLESATEATLDLAAALKIDLKAAALLMGKAAAGETSTLTRYGLVIEKGKTKAESFARVLEAVNEKFGGAAQVQAATYGGKMQQLSNAFGDLQETIGKAITQNEAFGDLQTRLIGKLKNIGASVEKWIEANEELIKQVSTKLISALGGVISFLGHIIVRTVAFTQAMRDAGIFLGIFKDHLNKDEKALKETREEIEAVEQEIGVATTRWKNLFRIEEEGFATVGASSTQATMIIIENLNAELNKLKEREAQLAKKTELPEVKIPTLDKLVDPPIPGPTPEQVEQRNFALEAMHLEHLERRFALTQDASDRELELMEIRFEQESLALDEKLAAFQEKLAEDNVMTQEQQIEHDAIMAEMDMLKKTQELEREALLQKQIDKLKDEQSKKDEKRHKNDLKSITKAADLDYKIWKNLNTAKFQSSKATADLIESISNNLFIASGKRSKELFRISQAASIGKAIMNTAEGATKALGQGGFMGIAMAAAVIAFGAAQIATIASQKMPAMAEGGIVTKPTTILAGEAGAEAIIPLDQAEEEGFGDEGRQQLVFNFTGPFLGDPEEAREFALAIDEELYQLKIQGQSLAFA